MIWGKTHYFRKHPSRFSLHKKNPPVGSWSKNSGISQWHGFSGHVFWVKKSSHGGRVGRRLVRRNWLGGPFMNQRTLKHKLHTSTKGKVRGKWKQIKRCSCLLLRKFVEGCWNPTMFISKDANVVWSLSYVLWFHGVGDWKSQGKQCAFPSWKNTRQVGAVKTLVYYTYVFLMLWTYASNP